MAINLDEGSFYQGPWTDQRNWSAKTDQPVRFLSAGSGADSLRFSEAFDRAFDHVIGHEGGYVNDPRDPGGETKFGISAKAYPDLNIKTLTVEDAKRIYFSDYWHKAGCYMLPAGLAYAVFDAAVNAGVGRATRWMQEAVGTVPDGRIGPATRAAISASMRNPLAVLETLNAIRLKHYMSLSNMTDRFGLGWSRRVLQVHTTALSISGDA